MPPTNDSTSKQHAASAGERRRMYRALRERTERKQRQRQRHIQRLVQQQNERRRFSFRNPGR